MNLLEHIRARAAIGRRLHAAEHIQLGAIPPRVIALSAEVVRNSANDATDANEVTMATLVVPAGIGLKAGAIIEAWSWWEHTGGASTKTLIERINGTSAGSTNATTNTTFNQRQVWHVMPDGSLMAVNAFAGTGGGGSTTAFLSGGVADVNATGFTWTYTCKWGAAASAELIRLKMAKLVAFPVP